MSTTLQPYHHHYAGPEFDHAGVHAAAGPDISGLTAADRASHEVAAGRR